MAYVLSLESQRKLATVHPDLARVVKRAIALTKVDFRVTEGKRSLAAQQRNVAIGASQTMNSRHLTGHAVDVVALLHGQVRWDWPLYAIIAKAMKEAAKIEQVPIEWGGDWKSFRDGPHFQLPWNKYNAGSMSGPSAIEARERSS